MHNDVRQVPQLWPLLEQIEHETLLRLTILSPYEFTEGIPVNQCV